MLPDDIFKFLDAVYERKKGTDTWWAALEDAVRKWNAEHKTRKDPTKIVSDYLHRKSQP